MPDASLRRRLHVALLASGEPLSVAALGKLFGERNAPARQELRAALAELARASEGSGVSLVEVASGWQYQIDAEFADVVGRLWEQRPPRYSMALLETLALIAYRQPITRGEIEQVRGVEPSTSIMQTLTERGWVRVAGHRQTPGRPALYVTTPEFLNYFRLRSLKDLPPLPKPRDPDEVHPPLPLPSAEAPQTAPAADGADIPAAAPAGDEAGMAEDGDAGAPAESGGEGDAAGASGADGAELSEGDDDAPGEDEARP